MKKATNKTNVEKKIEKIEKTHVKFFKSLWKDIKEACHSIWRWIGLDGLVNMESCIILIMLFGFIVDEVLAGLIVMVMAVCKTCYDKYKSHHEGEMHDFICCMIGILIGIVMVGYQI